MLFARLEEPDWQKLLELDTDIRLRTVELIIPLAARVLFDLMFWYCLRSVVLVAHFYGLVRCIYSLGIFWIVMLDVE